MKNIVVAGDVAIDWLCWNIHKREYSENDPEKPPNWSLYQGMRMIALPGGALLLAALVEESTKTNVVSSKIENIENIPPDKVIHSITKLGQFPAGQNADDASRVYRVQHYCGFCGPHNGNTCPLPIVDDTADASMVIIDDAGNKYRDTRDCWPKAILQENSNPLVILKMSRPIPAGSNTNPLFDHLAKHHKDRLWVIVNANDLRKEGANISRCLSWEKTAEDFMREMLENPVLKNLKWCPHLIVRFGLDGAMYYSWNPEKASAVLLYDPKHLEDGFVGTHQGYMQGTMAAFTAIFASSIYREVDEQIRLDRIKEWIQYGIIGSRLFFKKGFGTTNNIPGQFFEPAYPFEAISHLKAEDAARISWIDVPIPDTIVPFLSGGNRGAWTILRGLPSVQLENVAYDIVKNGIDNIPAGVPICRYAKLVTADRSEIESYQGIKNLMQEYISQNTRSRPLSIAVFGPPGSGKSFGVTNLAESVAPKAIQKIEFNVSQFSGLEDLASAFHQVRDCVLAGKIPLVFFDEFDSYFEGKLGWLKYFLSPMQDGLFKDRDRLHPIGKSIFVFAGGTRSSFQEFSCEKGNPEEIREFREVKGTDFISRLRGYVNVLGPNPLEGTYDLMFVIRRALLLRSMLERNANHLITSKGKCRIDENVLRAFIRVPEYIHGARSMEAIIDMSTLEGREQFEKASLPSEEQLDLHVDAESFTNLVRRETFTLAEWENIAKALHEDYLRTVREGESTPGPAYVPWDKLTDEYKLSNFRQAEQIPRKLEQIGYGLVAVGHESPQIVAFNKAEIETLARHEHDLWMREKRERGWRYGSERNEENKIHPCLVSWYDLPPDEKAKDESFSRQIPTVMANAGFEVRKLAEISRLPG